MRRIFREVLSLILPTGIAVAFSGLAVILLVLFLSLLYWPESPFD